jgi:O-antigen/teichoic acid export membrane protein
MRILAETSAMPLLARRRLKPFTLLFAFLYTAFVAGAAIAMPLFGLIGAATAYGAATALAVVATFVTCRSYVLLKLERTTALCLVRAVLLLGVAMAAGFLLPFGIARIAIAGIAAVVWLAWTLQDELPKGALSKLRPSRASPQ